MKKLFAVLLVAIMLLSMGSLSALAENKPIEINVIGPYSAAASSEEGYKMVQDWILKNTGVLVNGIMLDGSNDTEKKNMLLTGDTLIDVWWGDWKQYHEFQMIQPINQYMDLLPNTIKAWEHFSNAFGMVTDAEGNIWGLPRVASRCGYQTFIREDWLQKLGYTEDQYPTTFEELEKFLYAVKAADPYGNGETIPLITRKGLENLEYHFLGSFTKYGYSNWMDTDGLIKPFFLQEGFYDFLAKMHQWYVDGIIHAENPTWNTATVQQYLSSGRVAVSGAYGTDCCRQYTTVRANNPEAKYWLSYDGMIGPNGELCETVIKANTTGCLFNVKSPKEHVLAFIKVMEFLMSDWANNYSCETGPQGIYWDYDTANYGKEAATQHIVYDITTDPIYNGDFWYTIGAMEWDCVMYDADGVRNMQNYWIHELQGNTAAAKTQFDFDVAYNSTILHDNVMGATDVETLRDEELVKFFTGERELNETEWAKFLSQLETAGIQEYCKELTRQYKEAKGL